MSALSQFKGDGATNRSGSHNDMQVTGASSRLGRGRQARLRAVSSWRVLVHCQLPLVWCSDSRAPLSFFIACQSSEPLSRALLCFVADALVLWHYSGMAQMAEQTGTVARWVPRTARERARAEITREILDAGRRHLATDGAAALSLRAIA